MIAFTALGQVRKEWQAGYKLSVLDFEAEVPPSQEGQGQNYYLAAHLDYSKLHKHSASVAKNINYSVTAYFIPAQSWLQQGEGTEILLRYAQLDFDLLELYARKYRQRLHKENKTIINPRFLLQVQQEINTALIKRRQEMQNALAESNEKANAFHEQILKEITALIRFSKNIMEQ